MLCVDWKGSDTVCMTIECVFEKQIAFKKRV